MPHERTFDLHLDKAAFKRWLRDQKRKYEWKDGRVVQMANVTRGHSRVVANMLRAMSLRVDGDTWAVVASDFGVENEAFVIELTDRRTEVRLDGLGCAVTIEELYRGVLPV